jgi:chromosomal replication initiator protein
VVEVAMNRILETHASEEDPSRYEALAGLAKSLDKALKSQDIEEAEKCLARAEEDVTFFESIMARLSEGKASEAAAPAGAEASASSEESSGDFVAELAQHYPPEPGRTFESFSPAPSDQTVLARLRAVSSSDSGAFLFLTGPAGSGKTHLMHAVAHDLMSREPGARIVVMPAKDLAQVLQKAQERLISSDLPMMLSGARMIGIEDLEELPTDDEEVKMLLTFLIAFIAGGSCILILSSKEPLENLTPLGEGLRDSVGQAESLPLHSKA